MTEPRIGDGDPLETQKLSPLPRSFYYSAPEIVARRLLGKILISRAGAHLLAGRIVEVEAYLGADDPAAHAFSGATPRNTVLFGLPGHAYVYFIYGMHSCLNVSCEPEGRAGCVLLRALEPLGILGCEPRPSSEAQMRSNRGLTPSAPVRLIASGPGRLCQALGITRATHNGIDLTSDESQLQIADDGFCTGEVIATPRIGIRKAAERPLRFYLVGNPHVSAARRGRS